MGMWRTVFWPGHGMINMRKQRFETSTNTHWYHKFAENHELLNHEHCIFPIGFPHQFTLGSVIQRYQKVNRISSWPSLCCHPGRHRAPRSEPPGVTQKWWVCPRQSWFHQRKWTFWSYQIWFLAGYSRSVGQHDGLKGWRYQHLDCCMNQVNWEFWVTILGRYPLSSRTFLMPTQPQVALPCGSCPITCAHGRWCFRWRCPFDTAWERRYEDFHSHGGTSIAGWFMRKNPLKMDEN